MKRAFSPGLLLAIAIAMPAASFAQSGASSASQQPRTAQRPQPAPRSAGIGIRAYAMFGSTMLAAQETFDAVSDAHTRGVAGGGAQVTNIWKGLFADVGVGYMSLTGARVFVNAGQVFELGIPLEITMRPVDVAGGWRATLLRGRLSPYAGAGVTYLSYREVAEFAGDAEDVNRSGIGPLILGGVDVRVWRSIYAGAEVRYRRVDGIFGEGGVSAEFDEDDAGGVSAAARLSIVFR